ncbi:MAG: hypothetical protein BAJATHORv1_10337 [Candidatus Thorarchaeota archaeon]|nr:MAG: hypothetical protein BAJATHORv1_10337 [Candidatus Thorarchaeota archaeon]
MWIHEVTEVAEPADGRVAPSFRPYHVAVALIMIGRQQPIGRYELCSNLSIGEGSARTLLKRLSENDFITPEGKQGQKLTRKGQNLFEDIVEDVPFGLFLEIPNLVVYEKAYANIVKGKADRVKDGIRQRDEAIIQGGYGKAGATTLIFTDGMLEMPPDHFKVVLEYEAEALLIRESLRPENGDVIVVGSSDEANLAREISMAAVMTLFRED